MANIQLRGQINIVNGIGLLRGYATIDDLFKSSSSPYKYQRGLNETHKNKLVDFILKGTDDIKFLPEVILTPDPKCKDELHLKARKHTKDVKIVTIEMPEQSLHRLDGNHRIEALNSALNNKEIQSEKKKKLQNMKFSFCIILWDLHPDTDISDIDNSADISFIPSRTPIVIDDSGAVLDTDNSGEPVTDETNLRLAQGAAVFYILNSKAKPLVSEENFKGLVNVEENIFSDAELSLLNKVLPILRKINTEKTDLPDGCLKSFISFVEDAENKNEEVYKFYIDISKTLIEDIVEEVKWFMAGKETFAPYLEHSLKEDFLSLLIKIICENTFSLSSIPQNLNDKGESISVEQQPKNEIKVDIKQVRKESYGDLLMIEKWGKSHGYRISEHFENAFQMYQVAMDSILYKEILKLHTSVQESFIKKYSNMQGVRVHLRRALSFFKEEKYGDVIRECYILYRGFFKELLAPK